MSNTNTCNQSPLIDGALLLSIAGVHPSAPRRRNCVRPLGTLFHLLTEYDCFISKSSTQHNEDGAGLRQQLLKIYSLLPFFPHASGPLIPARTDIRTDTWALTTRISFAFLAWRKDGWQQLLRDSEAEAVEGSSQRNAAGVGT
jgi:hypothetical protein